MTQKSLYTGLFVIGLPMLWIAAPLSTVFWIVGASSVLILGHASMLEPGVVSSSTSPCIDSSSAVDRALKPHAPILPFPCSLPALLLLTRCSVYRKASTARSRLSDKPAAHCRPFQPVRPVDLILAAIVSTSSALGGTIPAQHVVLLPNILRHTVPEDTSPAGIWNKPLLRIEITVQCDAPY